MEEFFVSVLPSLKKSSYLSKRALNFTILGLMALYVIIMEKVSI